MADIVAIDMVFLKGSDNYEVHCKVRYLSKLRLASTRGS